MRNSQFFLLVLHLICWQSASPSKPDYSVLDVLSEDGVAAANSLLAQLRSQDTVYLLATVKLPGPAGGSLIQLLSRSSKKRLLEVIIMSKSNKVLLRSAKKKGQNAVAMQNVLLADGQAHSILLRLARLRGDTTSVSLYVDCNLVHSGDGHKELFSYLSVPVDSAELKPGIKGAFRKKGTLTELQWVFGGSLSQVGEIHDCSFQDDQSSVVPTEKSSTGVDGVKDEASSMSLEGQRIEPDPGRVIPKIQNENSIDGMSGDFSRQLLHHVSQFTDLLRELRDDVRQQVKEISLLRGAVIGCHACSDPGFGHGSGIDRRRGPGYSGMGSGCEQNPCFPGVTYSMDERGAIRCGDCPDGYTGNGTHCDDIDECKEATPCFHSHLCINSVPGFSCVSCPPGFTDNGGQGTDISFTKTHQQVCTDIDECDDGRNGGCVADSMCINIPGSFHCGACNDGFEGNQSVGCRWGRSCPNGQDSPCHRNAECVLERDQTIQCIVSNEQATPFLSSETIVSIILWFLVI
uniref:thrombospondin-3a-like n=1 Tax=Myxine glutinosa TaxID=7769 RepID=UPI00358E7E38